MAMNAAPALDAPLDMAFDLGSAPAPAPAAAPDLDLPHLAATQPMQPIKLDAPEPLLDENALAFDMPAPVAPTPAAPAAAKAAPAQPDSGMIEFDMGSISLDLDKSVGATDSQLADTAGAELTTAGSPLDLPAVTDGEENPLATKLALAEEFNAIGDPDGARSLAEEVLAEASGDLKSRAQRLLAEIG
jgi:pilus assembly protein FimV